MDAHKVHVYIFSYSRTRIYKERKVLRKCAHHALFRPCTHFRQCYPDLWVHIIPDETEQLPSWSFVSMIVFFSDIVSHCILALCRSHDVMFESMHVCLPAWSGSSALSGQLDLKSATWVHSIYQFLFFTSAGSFALNIQSWLSFASFDRAVFVLFMIKVRSL